LLLQEKDGETIKERALMQPYRSDTLINFFQTAGEGEKQEPALFHRLLLDR
jgi:hypothetical protein